MGRNTVNLFTLLYYGTYNINIQASRTTVLYIIHAKKLKMRNFVVNAHHKKLKSNNESLFVILHSRTVDQ